MPGIVDVEINDLNRGSIKKAQVNIKCHNRAQFDVIDVLYMRLGYTVCLEWGWNKYISSSENNAGTISEELKSVGETLIDKHFWEVINEDYTDFLDKIEKRRRENEGNYDGIIGVVSNFSWNFNPDGSYDIKIEIISLGDVIESLKVNLPPLVDEKVDPYAARRFDSLQQALQERQATEEEFYTTLYPGLREELNKVYEYYKNAANSTVSPFNWSFQTNALYTGESYSDEGGWAARVNTSVYDQYQLDYTNIVNIGGLLELFQKKMKDFDWGMTFTRIETSNKSTSYWGFDQNSENADFHWFIERGPTEVNIIGGVNRDTYIMADNRDWDSFQKLNTNQMDVNDTNTWIFYSDENQVYKAEYFLNDGGLLTNNTPSNEKKFSNSQLSRFTWFTLFPWVDARGANEEVIYNLVYSAYGEWPTNQVGPQNEDGKFTTLSNEFTFKKLGFLAKSRLLFSYYSLESFYTLFYDAAGLMGLTGGIDDFRFEDAGDPFDDLNENDKKLAEELTSFRTKIENSRYKNKIYNWFYNIRALYADYTYKFRVADPSELYDGNPLVSVLDALGFNDDIIVMNGGAPIENLNDVIGSPNLTGLTSDEGGVLGLGQNMAGNSSGFYYDTRNQPITISGRQYNIEDRRKGIKDDVLGFFINGHPDWDKKVGFPLYQYDRDQVLKGRSGDATFIDPDTGRITTYDQLANYFVGTLSRDFIKMDYSPIDDTYFVRLGVLLQYIQSHIIPKKKGNKKNVPIIRIDYFQDTNICYAIDNMISVNPKKCLIGNDSFYAGEYAGEDQYEQIYPELAPFLMKEDGILYGNLMNVYMNFNRIEEIFDSVDENNQVSLFTALKAMCSDINESLGSVNNIEPIIDKDRNIIKFIDQTPIPNIEKIRDFFGQRGGNTNPTEYPTDTELKKLQTPLEVFGYSNPGLGATNDKTTSNFVRNVGITTEISKNYATAITIGATANGEVPGMESTAFSRWNIGLKDRFKEYLVDAESEGEPESLEEENKSVIENYKSFISSPYPKLGLARTSTAILTLNDDYISSNINMANNYYTYAQAAVTNAKYDPTTHEGIIESSIGFLPINLKLEMDGIGGIRIYDFVKVNTAFLPSNYPETLEFICTGVNHKLSGNDWTTNLKTIATYIDKGSQSTSASS